MKKACLIHNPRCSKSREVKKILEDSGIEFVTIDYLKDGLEKKLVEKLPELLNLSYEEIIRSKEDIYKKLNLSEKKLSKKEWIETLITYPILLERPIFILNSRAVIGRPAEMIKVLLV